jgi:hypothetical protein
MLLDKWNPVFSPDVEVGAAEPAAEAPPVPMNEAPADGPGSGRGAMRKEIEKSVETVRKGERREAAPKKYVSTARKNAEEQGTAPAEEAAPAEGEEVVAEPETAAPEGWTKEAKAEWANLPPQVQAAVSKREVDMAKGVEEIKKKYAEVDKVLQPRLDVIRQHGHTPAQAVNQLFAWFEALGSNPVVAFPALAQSFKFDLRSIPGLIPQLQAQQPVGQPTAPGQPAAEEQSAGEMPVGMQKYINEINQRLEALQQGFASQLGQLNNSFQQQSQAKTEEILANWSKDKPHFEEVRKMMAHLIQSQAVPPLPNGAADLDKAYDMALWAQPEVRAQVLVDQQKAAADAAKAKQAAEQKAQQDQAAKARRAQGGSLSASAPGSPALPAKGKKGKTVAESIRDSIAELSE